MKNLAGMMKQAQEFQSRMAELQAELAEARVDGVSGAGLVTVTLNGKGEMAGIKIDPSLLKSEEVEILEDLVVAAQNDAKAKIEQMMQEKMKGLTGGLPLPPGLKLF
jgi:nucleoid-associated protein EbfC